MRTNEYKHLKSELTRELLLRVNDGFDIKPGKPFSKLWPLLQHIHSMVRCEEACIWLIENKLTGKELYEYWVASGRSYIRVMARIVKGLEHNDKLRSLRAGRDIR